MSHEPGIQFGASRTRTVDIWITKLSDVSDELRDAYRGLLDTAEAERLKQFLAPHARDQFLVARALLRTVLSRYIDVPCQAWAFGANAYGKPHVAAPEAGRDLRFSLSHTEGLAVCAVSHGDELGVDVENTQRDLDHLLLAQDAFAATEFAALERTPPSDRRQQFYSLWTLKEAYIKARGMGLSIPLDAFWFELDGDAARVRFTDRCADSPARWRFACFDPTPEHKLALAVAVPPDQGIRTEMRWTIPLACK